MPFSALPSGSAPLHCITGAMLGFAVDTGGRSLAPVPYDAFRDMISRVWMSDPGRRCGRVIILIHESLESCGLGFACPPPATAIAVSVLGYRSTRCRPPREITAMELDCRPPQRSRNPRSPKTAEYQGFVRSVQSWGQHRSSVTFPHDANHRMESPVRRPGWCRELIAGRGTAQCQGSKTTRPLSHHITPRLPFRTMRIAPRNRRYGGREPSRMPRPGVEHPKNRQMPRILVRGDSHISYHRTVAVPHHAFKTPIFPTRKARAPGLIAAPWLAACCTVWIVMTTMAS